MDTPLGGDLYASPAYVRNETSLLQLNRLDKPAYCVSRLEEIAAGGFIFFILHQSH